MAEGLFIPGIAMIFMKRRAPLAGLLSLVLGGGFSVLSFLGSLGALPFSLPAWPHSVPYGLALSVLGFGVGIAHRSLGHRPVGAPPSETDRAPSPLCSLMGDSSASPRVVREPSGIFFRLRLKFR